MAGEALVPGSLRRLLVPAHHGGPLRDAVPDAPTEGDSVCRTAAQGEVSQWEGEMSCRDGDVYGLRLTSLSSVGCWELPCHGGDLTISVFQKARE